LGHEAPSLDVESVSLPRLKLLHRVDVLEGLIDIALLEGTPGQVLVNFEVALVSIDCSLVLSHGLIEVTLFFVQEADLDKSVGLSLQGKSIGQDGVLEITDGLLNLVSLGEDHT